MGEYTFELFDLTHRMRVEGRSFGAVANRIFAEHGFMIERRALAKKYHYYADKYRIEAAYDQKRATSKASEGTGKRHYYPRNRKKNGVDKKQEDLQRACLMLLIDLVRYHGEVVFNRLTGEIVSGGYPNVSIPDVGTPRFVNAYSYHGSLSGSQAALCAENGK